MDCQTIENVVAIVDDEAPVRAGLERLVRSRGYRVTSYASASDFLRSLDISRPACVLLDLHMPVVNGFDVLAALRERSDSIPVIVVTGNAGPEVAGKVLSMGAIVCLDKPVDAPTLFDAISRALDTAQQSR